MFASTTSTAIAIMLETITRKPVIDGLSDEGIVPSGPCTGAVTLAGVSFAYPARPDALVCKDYDLTILPGETAALVGASGCGKVRPVVALGLSVSYVILFLSFTSANTSLEFDVHFIRSVSCRVQS
jgi:ABC-type multidrug transport system fused ATPase/permease subunit